MPMIALECELSVYRKGSLAVSLDLQQGIMIWRESRQWCNNFIRSLTREQIRELRVLIDHLDFTGCGSVSDDRIDDEEIQIRHSILKLTAVYPECQLTLDDGKMDQQAWRALRQIIEKISRVPFQL